MSMTIRQTIQEALEQATVVGIGEAPSAEEAVTALKSHNLLITSRAMGNWSQVGEDELESRLSLPDDLSDYYCAMLAAKLCAKYGKAIPEAVARTALDGEEIIRNAKVRVDQMRVDDGLLGMPSSNSARLL